MEKGQVIAAVRNGEQLALAAGSGVDIIYMLSTNIVELGEHIALAHGSGKKIFVHLDLADGIGKDEYGIRYLKEQGADGIITTRSNIVKLAKRIGITCVQRFFIIDSQSVATTAEVVKGSKADMIEIMPGTVTKVIAYLSRELDVPIVAGGLLETREEVDASLKSGAAAVSTGKVELWD